MKTIYVAATAIALSLLLVLAPATATELPQKAINVEDGIVAVRTGVMPNPDAQPALPIGKFKHQTRYFVDLVNESPYPVFPDATWSFPDGRDGKVVTSKPAKGKKVPPGGSYWFYFDKLGMIVDQKIVVEIAVWADEKRTKRVGGQAVEMEFSQPDVDVFLANFPSAFKNQPKNAPRLVISGWRDIPKPRTDVPGTDADALLQQDIQYALWKSDSTRRFTCERTIVDATPITVDDSVIFSRMPDEARLAVLEEYDAGMFGIERWRGRSCGQEIVYDVLMSPSDRGGTDLLVSEVTEPSQPLAVTDSTEPN